MIFTSKGEGGTGFRVFVAVEPPKIAVGLP
jgi:hypothetical protein